MDTTIDKAGRVVIPKALRDALGFRPGPVRLVVDGAGIRIEPAVGGEFVERGGRLVIDGGEPLTDDDVRRRRLEDQRHDALVGAAASEAGLPLLSRDDRAAETYRLVGATVIRP